MVTPVRTARQPPPTTCLASDVRGLIDEHALLARGVQLRADSVLALAAARTWPYAELDTLTGFLRTAVLPHIIDAADRLYPNGVAPPAAHLRAEHAHIHALTEQLEHTATGALPQLRRLVDGLEHHMNTAHSVLAALLAALEDTPCVTDPDPGAPHPPALILIDRLREDHTVQIRVHRLRPGQPAQIHASRSNGLGRSQGDRYPARAPGDGRAGQRETPAIAYGDRRPDPVGRTQL